MENSSSSVQLALLHNPVVSEGCQQPDTGMENSDPPPLCISMSSHPPKSTDVSLSYLPLFNHHHHHGASSLTSSHSVGASCHQVLSPPFRSPPHKGCFHHTSPLTRHLMVSYFSALVLIVKRTASDDSLGRMFKDHSPRPPFQTSSHLSHKPYQG